MLFFAAPFWLFAPPAAALAGVWALWRGRGRARLVPSTKLWRGLTPRTAPVRRRVDPLWLVVLLAAILAALALARPMWAVAKPVTPAAIDWNVRSVNLGGVAHAEAWARLPEAPAGSYLLTVSGDRHDVTAEALRAGTTITIPAAGSVTLELQRAGTTLAVQTFAPAPVTSFGLLEIAGQASVDPALRRAFAVQGAAADPTVRPVVALVNAATLGEDDTAALADAALVIAQSVTPLEGVTTGALVQAPSGGWVPAATESSFGWPAFVPLKDVRVTFLREATFSPDWQILATAGGHPWIALRQLRRADGTTQTQLWLASDPATQTTWPTTPGFVAFFADLTSRTVRQVPGRIIDWLPQIPISPVPAAVSMDLTPALAVAAIALLFIAAAWFIVRGGIRG